MLRRFFMAGPAGLFVGKLFPEKGDKDDKGEPAGGPRCRCEREHTLSDKPEFTPKGSNEGPDVVQVLLRDNTDLLVDNTTVETALFTFPVPAYTLDGDRGLRIKVNFAVLNNTGVARIFTYKVYYGTTVLYTGTQSHPTNASEYVRSWEVDFLAKNSDAEQEIFGGANLNGTFQELYGTSTEDATTDLDFVITVTMPTADANEWFMHRRSIVELL
jgi:hypothetical protein